KREATPAKTAAASTEAAAPAVDPPAAVPEPAETTETPQSTAGKLEGAALWEAARAALIATNSLFETWLSAASFVRHDEGVFVIGFSPEQRFFRDSLSRYEKDIERQISAL